MAKILIVDSDEVDLSNCREILVEDGHHVVVQQNHVLAGAAVFQKQPDLLLLEVELEGARGTDFITIFRQADQTGRMKIFFHSAIDAQELDDLARIHGADGSIHKQGHPGDYLVEEINKVLAWL